MSASRRTFTKEFKDNLCQEVINDSKPVVEVAKSYGVGAETLRRWLIKYRETQAGTQTVASSAEATRLKALEKENQELRAEVSFLKKASAYFAREQR